MPQEFIFSWGRCGPEAQDCDCNATVVGSIPTHGNELLLINILISSARVAASAGDEIFT